MKQTLWKLTVAVGIATALGSLPIRAADVQPKEEPKRNAFATGTIESIDKKENTVTVRLLTTSKTFKVDPDCEFVLGKRAEASLEGLRVGDNVRISYDEEKGVATAHRIARRGIGPDKQDAREREQMEQHLNPYPSERKLE